MIFILNKYKIPFFITVMINSLALKNNKKIKDNIIKDVKNHFRLKR